LRLNDWRFNLAYTWLDAPQTISAVTTAMPADGSYIFPVPVTIQAVRRSRNIASINATWAPTTLPLTATLTVRYNGRQNDYAFDANYDRLIVDLKAYTLVNLNATYDVNPHVQIFGRVENLLNDHYQEEFTYAAAGRAAYGGVRLKL
jgi:vitamin B12 transporter